MSIEDYKLSDKEVYDMTVDELKDDLTKIKIVQSMFNKKAGDDKKNCKNKNIIDAINYRIIKSERKINFYEALIDYKISEENFVNIKICLEKKIKLIDSFYALEQIEIKIAKNDILNKNLY